MYKETFFIDGVDASSVGIKLQKPIEFSAPVPIVETESIPGRNGNLIYDTGAYENRTGEASCYALQKNVETALSGINKFLFAKKGYRRLETSNDPNHYWMVRVFNGAKIENRVRLLAPFEIKFDCKPQRFVKEGDNSIVYYASNTLYNNYGFDSFPLITVYGSGSGSVTIGDYYVQLRDIPTNITLDCETKNAYNNDGNQNANINTADFPILVGGANKISFDGGVNRVEIIPRWWEL